MRCALEQHAENKKGATPKPLGQFIDQRCFYLILEKITILTLVGTLHVENTVFKGNLHAHTGAISSALTCAGFRQRLGRYYHVVMHFFYLFRLY